VPLTIKTVLAVEGGSGPGSSGGRRRGGGAVAVVGGMSSSGRGAGQGAVKSASWVIGVVRAFPMTEGEETGVVGECGKGVVVFMVGKVLTVTVSRFEVAGVVRGVPMTEEGGKGVIDGRDVGVVVLGVGKVLTLVVEVGRLTTGTIIASTSSSPSTLGSYKRYGRGGTAP
jgi:hypothetical protein